MRGFDRERGPQSEGTEPDPVDEARIADLFSGDQEPEDLEPSVSASVRAAGEWVRATRSAVRGMGPADDLSARIRRGLPVGTPGAGSRDRRVHRTIWLATAATLLFAAFLGWTLWSSPSTKNEEKPPSEPIPAAALGLAHLANLDGTNPRTLLHLDGSAIQTGAAEEARIHFSPWRSSPYPSEDELTIVSLDPESKLDAKLYRPEDEPGYAMRQAMFLERSLGMPTVETSILELTVLHGTAEIIHHGERTELRFPDMVLVAPLRSVVKTGEEDPVVKTDPSGTTRRKSVEDRPPQDPVPATVQGTVTQVESGEAVTNFDIVAWHLDVFGSAEYRWEGAPPSPITFENPEGSYRIDELEPGRYRFFARTKTHVLGVSDEIDLESGERQRIDFALRRGHAVTGRVLDARTKRPIFGARVSFLAHAAEDSLWRYRDVHGTVRTDERGVYVCENRPPGRQTIWVTAEGYGSERAGPIHVRRDGSVLRDIDVFLEPEARIEGRVTPYHGMDPRTLSIVVNSLAPFDPGRALLSNDLTYEVGRLSAGRHFVHLVHERNMALATKMVTVEHGQTLRVDFGPSGTRVPGLVRDAEGRALRNLEVSFYQTSDTWRRRAPSFRTYTAADGSFEAWLPPGESFQIRLSRERGEETWKVYGPTIDVAATERTDPFTIQLEGEEVSGQITGSSLEGVWSRGNLVLSDTAVAGRRWTTRLLDERGRFSFPFVPPGTYRLSGALRGHVVEEQILRIGRGGRCGIDLGVLRQARVVLRLIDEEGNALSRMDVRSVSSLDVDGKSDRHWIDYGERGVTVHGLIPGATRLRVECREHGEIILPVVLQAEGMNEIVHQLERRR